MTYWLNRGLAALACTAVLWSVAMAGQWTIASEREPLETSGVIGDSQAVIPDSLTLPAALDFAREHHPDARVMRAGVAVARAESTFARVRQFNPEFEAQMSRGGRTLGSGTDGAVELGVSQEVELGGKRGARQNVANSRTRTAMAELAARRQEIESDVRARFQRALYMQDRLRILAELTGLDRKVVASTQARVRDGSITPLTGRLTELDLLRLDTQLRRSRSNYRQELVALGLAMGLPLPDSVRLIGVIDADSLQVPEDSVVTVALRIRLQGGVLLRRLDERRAELKLAIREGRPNITLGAGLSVERQSFGGGDFTGAPTVVGGITGAKDTDHLWRARMSVPLPLWQRNQPARARAAAEVSRGKAEYEGFVTRVRLETLAAVRRFEDAAEIYHMYLGRSSRVRQDLAMVQDAYADGRIPLDSYLTQKGRLVDTLLAQLESADAYWEARGALEAAVGLDLPHVNAAGGGR